MKKIDIHVHARRAREGRLAVGIHRGKPGATTYATPAELRKMYDAIGVEKGVLLPNASPEGAHYVTTNEDAFLLVQENPETLYWFCNIDPRMGTNSPNTDFSYYLEYYKALGAKGVGELTCNLYFDDPMVWNLFAHCETCAMPVTFHVGDRGGDYGLVDEIGLPRLEKTLQKFPKLKLLGHSQKFWAEIGPGVTEETRGGYPRGDVAEGGRVVALMRQYPNLCGDLSASSGANAVMRDKAFGYRFLEEFQDQLFYGTDICAPENAGSFMLTLSAYLDEAVANGHISRAAYEKISRTNALSILEG